MRAKVFDWTCNWNIRAPALLAAIVIFHLPCPAMRAETLISGAAQTAQVDISVANEAQASIARALDWLAAGQRPDGAWSNSALPALTALPLWAFALSRHPARAQVVPRAVGWLRGCVQPDGGIYRRSPSQGPLLPTYNTGLVLVALSAVGDPALTPVVLRARRFLAAGQHAGGDLRDGGFGYASGQGGADLDSSLAAYEAMRLSQTVEARRGTNGVSADLDWAAARRFIEQMRTQPGGSVTDPVATNDATHLVLRVDDSLTYAGMLSLIYAEADRNDPRLHAAFGWAVRHWSLDRHPDIGRQGTYAYYFVLTKALAAYGREDLPVRGGPPVFWRRAVIEKLLSLQRMDAARPGQGYWANTDARFSEDDCVLATAYAVLTLEVALGAAAQ